ncbi:MAG: rRNA maturation RNase YbeY [Hyphomicrobiaceae bacterium]|nr:rRNA maturation RNase YbeY [Hyphomicrobiaceae bacterium]
MTPVSSRSPSRRLLVDVVRRADLWASHVPEEALVLAAKAAFAACEPGPGRAEVSLLLGDDAEVRELNRNWRGKDEPTNVLSFPLGVAPCGDEPRSLGDVALACETVMREARERGIPPEQHAVHLVVHGMLHLMGFDHVSEEGAQEMEALETRILAELGFPDPYAPHAVLAGEEL